MPSGGSSPDPGLPSAVFNALHTMSYDSTAKAFVSGSTKYFLWVEAASGGAGTCQWFYATDSEGASNPKALVPQVTYDVIHNGTYNTSTGTISYGGNTYRIRLKRDTGSVQVAEATQSS